MPTTMTRAALGAGAGPRDEPAEIQRGVGRVTEPVRDHGCPEGQDRRAVDLDGGYGGHRTSVASWADFRDRAHPDKAAFRLAVR